MLLCEVVFYVLMSLCFLLMLRCELFGSFSFFLSAGFHTKQARTKWNDEWVKRRDWGVSNELFAVEPKWLRSSQLLKPSCESSIPKQWDCGQHALGRQKQSVHCAVSFQSQMEFCFPLAFHLSHSKSAPKAKSVMQTRFRNWLLFHKSIGFDEPGSFSGWHIANTAILLSFCTASMKNS